MRPPTVYLYDTNALIHGVRRDAVWDKIKSVSDPLMYEPKGLVCIVSHGELRSFGEKSQWGREKQDQMNFLLGYFNVEERITRQVIDAYALLDAYSHLRGVVMGKNDLWIAATAHVTWAVIVTTDKDFDHLDGKFLSRIYISTATNLQD